MKNQIMKYYDIETEMGDVSDLQEQVGIAQNRVNTILATYLKSKGIEATSIKSYSQDNDEYIAITYVTGMEKLTKEFEIEDINDFIKKL